MLHLNSGYSNHLVPHQTQFLRWVSTEGRDKHEETHSARKTETLPTDNAL